MLITKLINKLKRVEKQIREKRAGRSTGENYSVCGRCLFYQSEVPGRGFCQLHPKALLEKIPGTEAEVNFDRGSCDLFEGDLKK